MPSPNTTESTTEGETSSAEAKPPADVVVPPVSTKTTSNETVRATEEETASTETQQSEDATKSKTAVSPNIRTESKDAAAPTKESCPTEKESASSSNNNNTAATSTSNIAKAVSQQTPQGTSKGGRSSLTTPLTPQTQTQQAGKKQHPFLCYAVRNGRNLSHCILFHKADMERLICPQVEYKVCWSIQEAVTYILSDDKLPSVWAKKSATVSMSTARAASASASGASTSKSSSSSAGTKRSWVDGNGSESHTKKGKAANGNSEYLTSWSTTKAPTIITKSNIWNQGGGTSNPTSPNPLAAAADVGTTISSPWQARPIPKLAPTGIITSSSIWSGGYKGGGATMAKSFVTTGNKSVPTTILGGKRPTPAEVAQATAVRAIRASQRSFKRVKAANAAVAKSAARTATSLSTSTSTSTSSSSSSSKLPPQAAALVARNASKPKPILDYWDRMFHQLAHYKLKHKTFDNLTASSAGPLGTWAYRQRRFYQLAKVDDLTEDKMQKKAKLVEIGFSFQRTATTKKFANQLSKDGEGPTDPKVHAADLEKNGIVMASWSSSPLKGKSPTKQSDQRWNDMFQELVEYKQENEGGFSTMTNNSSRLGKWASDQRKAFKQFKAGYPLTLPLTQERLQKLIEIGFDLVREPRLNHVQVFEKNFDKMFEQMKLIKDTTGSCLVRRQGSQIPLYDWVIRLRKEISKIDKGIGSRLLDQKKIEQLHSIGFVTKKKPSWESQYQDLVKFHAAIGHTRVFLKGTESNPHLGKWVAKLRLMYRERNEGKINELTDERIQLLNELDFTWEAIKRSNPYPLPQERRTWEERFQELLQFEEQHGHLKVPQNLPGVGHWAHAQRKNYKLLKEGKKSPMTAQRALRLAEIGFELDTRPRNNKPDRYEQKM